MRFGWWPARTRPAESSAAPGYVDQVKTRYVTTDMTLERLERDVEIALRLEAWDIPKGGFDSSTFPHYLRDEDGRGLGPFDSLIGAWTAAAAGRAANKVVLLPPGAELTPIEQIERKLSALEDGWA